MGIKEGGERVSNVNKIITKLNDGFTVSGPSIGPFLIHIYLRLYIYFLSPKFREKHGLKSTSKWYVNVYCLFHFDDKNEPFMYIP